WLFEIKWDGYRALAYLEDDKARILSRKNLPFNAKFTPVVEALQELQLNAVLDGEIVALNSEGKGDFQLLQQWQKTGEGNLVYYVFDILWYNGYNLMELPLVERKEILQQILPANDTNTPKVRTKQWLKIKATQQQEVVIAGFTQTRGSRKHFGALVLGVYEKDKLVYVGHTGSGFDEATLRQG